MTAVHPSGDLQCWGGIECTVNRVGDAWFDQLERSGHAQRLGDLDLVAELGVRTLRYPLLWERTAPHDPAQLDWRWADERLARLRELHIEPVVGLVHHGSGPAYTHLLDPQFADKLAAYAGAVAARYPWLKRFTPVNEPLTTARFSGLYGLWYPHGRLDQAFVRMLLNQVRGIALSMRAIRRVIPDAVLVQTDDLGTTYSTARMAAQAQFDNERRWLGWDLLCGRVMADHPLRGFLEGAGVPARELEELVESPCPPDIIGVNHYVTSDRFLDEHVADYPNHARGGNGRDLYADVEAVRVLPEYRPWQVLEAAWQRYRIPLAITEAHLGCTREEQVRWLGGAWNAALAARARGCDVRAVTVWALFGSFDWDSLLTRDAGHYEPGAFDVRAPQPRPTALAQLTRELCTGDPTVPHWGVDGWWSRSERLLHRRASLTQGSRFLAKHAPPASRRRPLLICGAGTLAWTFAAACKVRGLEHRILPRRELDATDQAAVRAMLRQLDPWAVINATGFVRVDDAEREPLACFRDNLEATAVLATCTGERELPLVTFSTDLVFDGQAHEAYVESSKPNPLNIYGLSKAASEVAALERNPRTLCIRTAAFFGYWHISDFLSRAVCTLSEGASFEAIADVTISPTYVPDLGEAGLDLLLDGTCGLWHGCNQGQLTWAEFARAGARALGLDPRGVRDVNLANLSLPALRPRYSALASERAQLMPGLEDALCRFAATAKAGRLDALKRARP